MAHIRQARPDSGIGFQENPLETLKISPVRSEADKKDPAMAPALPPFPSSPFPPLSPPSQPTPRSLSRCLLLPNLPVSCICYRGTSLIRKPFAVGSFRKPIPRALRWFLGGSSFLRARYPYAADAAQSLPPPANLALFGCFCVPLTSEKGTTQKD